VPLGGGVALEPLEPPDRLAGEPAYLGELACDRERLGADALADGVADALGQHRLELVRGLRECLDLDPCPVQRRRHVGRAGAFVDPVLDAIVHRRQR